MKKSQKKSTIKQFLHKALSWDMYGQYVNFNINGESTINSYFGVVMTLLTYLTTLVYFGN